jgi:hypothetical protein
MQIKIWHLSTSAQNPTFIDESKSSLLLFDIVSTTFIPGKIYRWKKVSKLKVHKNENFFGFDFEICTFS